ncbi:MAG: VOC family protein, partial [Gemmatimonadales bacterium]|nr:VOC family protein [Gemmatimonadales bacterium]
MPDALRLGPVSLQVSSLDRSLAYYTGVLGLRPVRSKPGCALLGGQHGGPLVELREHRGARPMPARGRLGLYHFAILLPDRPALGRLVRQ